MSTLGEDAAAGVAQLQQCVAVFLELGELIGAERDEAKLRSYYRGRLEISEAILALDELALSGRWSAGRVARIRRYDGRLDLAVVVDLVQGVYEAAEGVDEQEVHGRVCWLRPRNRRELTSSGFLVPFRQLLPVKSDWRDQEWRALDPGAHAWVMGSHGYLEKTELISIFGDRIQCDDRRYGQRTIFTTTLTVCPDSSTPTEKVIADVVAEDRVDEEAFLESKTIDKAARIASWESYTRGFGSRMLLKMGYRWYCSRAVLLWVY